ncbi:MAG TPA: sporulation protein YtfJ [Candidatus Onthovicinus excrementipullorum]|nr:sporulation protein YtfJ [Candidatus Onthovicinus excrementipullorum]
MKENSAAAGILASTIEKVRDLVDTSTIIGEPIYAEGGMTIIPVTKVTYGLATGGSDFPSKSNQEIFGGGGGVGVTITPVAFLVIHNGEVSLKHITAYDNAAERIVNLVPEMFDKITSLTKKDAAKDADLDAAVDAAVSAPVEEK